MEHDRECEREAVAVVLEGYPSIESKYIEQVRLGDKYCNCKRRRWKEKGLRTLKQLSMDAHLGYVKSLANEIALMGSIQIGGWELSKEGIRRLPKNVIAVDFRNRRRLD